MFTNVHRQHKSNIPFFPLDMHWVFQTSYYRAIRKPKSLIKNTANEKNKIATLLVVLADKAKLPPYIILKRKTIPKGKLPEGAIFRCQDKGWTSELMQDLLHVVCNRQPGALLKQTAMLALGCISRVYN